MYQNLEKELKERKLTRGELAARIGRTPTTVSLKLAGKAPITLKEAAEIRDAIDSKLSIDYLFETESETV